LKSEWDRIFWFWLSNTRLYDAERAESVIK
jgi:hypothetical protein